MQKKEPTFEEAMDLSLLCSKAWEEGELSDEVLADKVAELLASRDGARGFLVICLASDCPLMDRLPESLVLQLRIAGEIIVDLTVRNLAMSTAMALHHQRQEDFLRQSCSERVTARSLDLLRLLDPKKVKSRLETLLNATNHGKGDDVAFLEKWGYDNEQKLAIASSVYEVAEQ
ncbi:hypothetical protein [Prochlorococcus sp. MIT 1307]|uniref:hypothetical protein n=1 Tax=Prochlorococcus sp. MIT 1307 TaxID=3096219 RepID=UPI002A75815B|nr:hypothetical protein [Prochlorococcus sp. MIT 1307]